MTRQIERVLAPFHPRPHWGKLHTMNAADLRGRYKHECKHARTKCEEKGAEAGRGAGGGTRSGTGGAEAAVGLGDWEEMCFQHDPRGKFRASPWCKEAIFGT